MTCVEAEPLLNARLDNELDMASSSGIDRHLAECRPCAARYTALQNLHDEIGGGESGVRAPQELEEKLVGQFVERKPTSNRPGRIWFSLAAVAAGIVAVLLLSPSIHSTRQAEAVEAEVLDSHLRALQLGHLLDVPTSDQHTVKPWFQGKTSFSPLVPDLTGNGFVPAGGRLEVIHQQPAAALVYMRSSMSSAYISPLARRRLQPPSA